GKYAHVLQTRGQQQSLPPVSKPTVEEQSAPAPSPARRQTRRRRRSEPVVVPAASSSRQEETEIAIELGKELKKELKKTGRELTRDDLYDLLFSENKDKRALWLRNKVWGTSWSKGRFRNKVWPRTRERAGLDARARRGRPRD